jgi:diphosphomevalonate decarboxylase
MNLSNCYTVTEVSVNNKSSEDNVILETYDGQSRQIKYGDDSRDNKIFDQINLIRGYSKNKKLVTIRSKNSFPTKAGIASSASGFSALTMALCEFFEVAYDINRLANLISKAGSISATRSICDYFGSVELKDNKLLEVKNCTEFLDLDLIDIVAIVTDTEKTNSSLEGQKIAETSPLFYTRLDSAKRNFVDIKSAAKKKYWTEVGRIIELESVFLHAVMNTSNPNQFYMNYKSWIVIEKILELRKSGVEVYFTVDAGCNVHLITKKLNYEMIFELLSNIPEVIGIISNSPCLGTRQINLKDIDGFNWN